MSRRKLQVKLLELLIIFIPYHYLIFGVLLSDIPIVKLWRDLVIILICLLGVSKKEIGKIDKYIFFHMIFIIIGVFYVFVSPYKEQAMNIFRVYVLPLILFDTVRRMDITAQEFKIIFKKIYINTIILCVYGIIQAYILGDSFLIKIGYFVNESGRLNDSYYLSGYGNIFFGRSIQRIVSTFSSANIFGFYLGLVFVISIFLRNYFTVSKKKYVMFVFLVGITLLLTFSRSTWLALVISLVFSARRQVSIFIKKQYKSVILLTVLTIVLVAINHKIQQALLHIFISSFSGTDTSMVSHYQTLDEAFKLIYEKPWGLGLGINGPRALNYGSANLVESSILLIIFEFGILGAVIYFFDLLLLFFDFLICSKNFYSKLGMSILLFVIIDYLNIPYVQELECTCLAYISLAQTWKNRRRIFN